MTLLSVLSTGFIHSWASQRNQSWWLLLLSPEHCLWELWQTSRAGIFSMWSSDPVSQYHSYADSYTRHCHSQMAEETQIITLHGSISCFLVFVAKSLPQKKTGAPSSCCTHFHGRAHNTCCLHRATWVELSWGGFTRSCGCNCQHLF
jgi:hypothetical protein